MTWLKQRLFLRLLDFFRFDFVDFDCSCVGWKLRCRFLGFFALPVFESPLTVHLEIEKVQNSYSLHIGSRYIVLSVCSGLDFQIGYQRSMYFNVWKLSAQVLQGWLEFQLKSNETILWCSDKLSWLFNNRLSSTR